MEYTWKWSEKNIFEMGWVRDITKNTAQNKTMLNVKKTIVKFQYNSSLVGCYWQKNWSDTWTLNRQTTAIRSRRGNVSGWGVFVPKENMSWTLISCQSHHWLIIESSVPTAYGVFVEKYLPLNCIMACSHFFSYFSLQLHVLDRLGRGA